jgi:hypothetical protein
VSGKHFSGFRKSKIYGTKLQKQTVQKGDNCYQIFFFIQYQKNIICLYLQHKNTSDEIQKNSTKTKRRSIDGRKTIWN